MTEFRTPLRADDAVHAEPPKPHFVHQRNVEETVGPGARQYLELVRSPEFPLPIVKLGKLRLCEREPFITYLCSLVELDQQPNDEERADVDDADTVLHEVLGKGALRAV
ncbi:MAG: hypothetical protein WBG86_16380 [Polyangiales bacterium]